MAHTSDQDEVWIVYNSSDFAAIVASEKEAEDICIMMGEFWTWKKLTAQSEEPK